MRPKTKIILALLFVAVFSKSCKDTNRQITTGLLLQEMTNREELTKFPKPFYHCRQFSSYDRESVSPNQPGWYANYDRSHFIRIEHNNRREFVLLDTEGPGAIVRFWITLGNYGGNGILRFYLDGNETPAIEGDVLEIMSGGALVEYPLSCSVSEETEYLKRGHNLYLPIPYSQHCKITYESDGIDEEPGAKVGEAFYYNINYRTYESETNVKTFEKSDLIKYKDELEETIHKLTNYDRDASTKTEKTTIKERTILPSEKLEHKFSGTQAIKKIALKLEADNYEEALRSTIIKIQFDGEQTVWSPIGDFFGTGYKLSPNKTWYTEVSDDGLLSCYWVMPFSKSSIVTIENLSKEPVQITDFVLEKQAYKWNKQSMYFGAGWYENRNINTRRKLQHSDTPPVFDINYVTLKGEGVLVGDGVTLFNTAHKWWGEGDEKIYVDGEDFPSHFGTGTEDYYGYAWSRPEKFYHPFIAQPDGSGSVSPGYVVNLRFRSLDKIPFTESLKFDMELWHWAETTINHAPISFWYMRSGGISNLKPAPNQAIKPVALKRSDIIEITED